MFFSDSTVLRLGNTIYVLAVPSYLLGITSAALVFILVWIWHSRSKREAED